MKTFALLLALAVAPLTVHSQDLRQTAAAKAACGGIDVHFDKGDGLEAHPVPPVIPQGKALVYVFGVNDPTGEACIGRCGATIKIGLDGQWIGAAWGNSFVFTTVNAGSHHLCANWQGHITLFSHTVALAPLTAEPGKTYFFAAHVSSGTSHGTVSAMTLAPLNEDQARMLLEAYPLSKAAPHP